MKYTAEQYLELANDTMFERGQEYDVEQERSMEKIVKIFNAYTDKNLTEYEGWLFMEILKNVRQLAAKDAHIDSLVDCIAYAALKAESAHEIY